MHGKIEAYVLEVAPDIADEQKRAQLKLKSGTQLDDALKELALPPKAERTVKLTKAQERMRSVTGGVRWFEKGHPSVSRRAQYLSKVISFPPEGADQLALAVLQHLYVNRFHGITLGAVEDGEAALSANFSFSLGTEGLPPELLAAVADATWGAVPVYDLPCRLQPNPHKGRAAGRCSPMPCRRRSSSSYRRRGSKKWS